MKYLSVCSGIEAATVAWHPLGWKPFAFSEIDKFPSAVLTHHYPSIPNFGDMNNFKDWPDEKIDLLVGGTPCQSFSIAGLRKGLADPRGNLALTYCAILDKYRPQWFVWENVPGVLSSDGGGAFGSIIGAVAELGYGFAYRVLDAQYIRVDGFGRAVPQRRRRVFVVGYLGNCRRAAEVLFDAFSLSGNSAPRRQEGQGFSTDVAPSLVSSGRGVERAGDTRGQDPVIAVPSSGLVAHSLRPEGFDASEDGTGRGTPIVPIAFSCKDYGADSGPVSPTLRSMGHDGSHANAGGQVAVAIDLAVRRLTPRECERLQGFPDDYTLVPVRNKPAADGPRYKSLGNSMAVNVMRWIGSRINEVAA